MSRRSSGGGEGIAVDEGQSFGPEGLFSRDGVTPSRLEHGETMTSALVATFLVTYDSYKKTVRGEVGDGLERRLVVGGCGLGTSGCLVYAIL